MNYKTLGDIMKRQHITPETLSNRIGLSLNRILAILAGSDPTVTELSEIAAALLLGPEEIDELFEA